MSARPVTFDHLRGKKQPFRTTVTIVIDQDLADEYDVARRNRDVAEIRAKTRPADTDAALEFLEADQRFNDLAARLEDDEAVVTFTFRGIGRYAFEKLIEKHPPTSEQRLKTKADGVEGVLQWNTETFPPVIIAACALEPRLTIEDALYLWNEDDNWNQAELGEILHAALAANSTRRTVDLGKDSARTRGSGPRSPTA